MVFQKKHPEISDKYENDVQMYAKCQSHENKLPYASNKAKVSIEKHRSRSVMELQSKRRRVSNTPKDESLSTAFIEFEHIDMAADLPSDEVKNGDFPVDEVNSSDLVDEIKGVRMCDESRIEIKKCRYEAKEIGDENAIKFQFEEETKRILFKDYFKIIAKNDDEVTAVCRNCKLIKGSELKQPIALRIHLMVSNS